MLPTEPPLSLHRLLAPVPPARAQETATATRQAPAPVPVPVSNATMAHSMHAVAKMSPPAAQDQLGNAATTKAAAQAAPAARLFFVPVKSPWEDAPTR
ncbi:hypothetical protein V2J94_00090 [Streptomyces sp. DSM 41524]|uniref:Uncharacterized protein n=1 Tax=Streptomyces asiaticus subsp. ignotus TaxID=3098222 RepID=A0ABU7PMK7_9ACTN|nr:hypothetical protein [Streptomyces sp. DSM 41524]